MAQIDPPCKTQVGDRGCMSQQDDHHLSTVPPYRRHLSNDIISHECQITQCNQCTCSCFSKPQSSRQSKQYVQNVSSTNGIHHHQCCQSQLVFECQQKQDCSSKFFARHNTQYNLSGVHVFQADPRHPPKIIRRDRRFKIIPDLNRTLALIQFGCLRDKTVKVQHHPRTPRHTNVPLSLWPPCRRYRRTIEQELPPSPTDSTERRGTAYCAACGRHRRNNEPSGTLSGCHVGFPSPK
ncbi:hypothetical protein Hamer_G002899 [Homarus americanus]|uniref:Uncharacterized protein n=1 Tax=Homarus americanus TaxID=6706 RepID=A0A8J5JYH1_HOMAM|nr:hypothetical protein Hamer_G002899 [Homarus americanus]